MKNIRTTSRFLRGGVLAGSLAVLFMFGSCSKDPTQRPDTSYSDQVCFLLYPSPAEAYPACGSRALAGGREAAEQEGSLPAGAGLTVLPLTDSSTSDTLFLHVSVSGGIGDSELFTRAVPITGSDFYDSFSVTGFSYADSWSETLTPNLMYDVQCKQSNGTWGPDKDYYWPNDSRKSRFFAYAPSSAQGLTFSGETDPGTPRLTYEIPADVSLHADLLTAASGEFSGDNSGQPASLTFGHALTAIRFVVGDDMMAGKIGKITLKGIPGSGSYAIGSSAWSDLGAARSFSVDLAAEQQSFDGTPGVAITSAEQTFLMIPQTLPAGASIEIVFTDDETNTARTLTCDLQGQTWSLGTTVTYSVSTRHFQYEENFTITPTADNKHLITIDYRGGSQNYTVTSLNKVIFPDGTSINNKAYPWTTEFYAYNEATSEYDIKLESRPEWLTAFTESGNGGSTQTFTATVGAQSGVTENVNDRKLQAADPVGSQSDPYDLSAFDISGNPQPGMTTANCYVVSAPGRYRIPIVYGNAVKNGLTNESAYKVSHTNTATNLLKTFIRHDGKDIAAPCLADNGLAPAKAAMLWNDIAPGVVEVDATLSSFDATIDGESKSLQYVTFAVSPDLIAQGNIVIAVYDASNTVLWSWHIWVTAEDLSKPLLVKNYMGDKNYMMPVNLGWSEGSSTVYQERSVRVSFVQQSATQPREDLIITQTQHTVSSGGNNPYYQWGRKDALLPSNGVGNVNKTWYDAAGASSTALATANFGSGNACIMNGIKSPASFCTVSGMDGTYLNLWSMDNTALAIGYNVADVPVVKTVYDPCPPGFHVARQNAFTGFSTTGQNTSTRTQFNVEKDWDNTNPGWYFYCLPNKDASGGTIFFPASGYRGNGGGGLSNVRSNCYSWAAVPTSAGYGRYLNFYSGYVYPLHYYYRGYGFSVRPVQELYD